MAWKLFEAFFFSSKTSFFLDQAKERERGGRGMVLQPCHRHAFFPKRFTKTRPKALPDCLHLIAEVFLKNKNAVDAARQPKFYINQRYTTTLLSGAPCHSCKDVKTWHLIPQKNQQQRPWSNNLFFKCNHCKNISPAWRRSSAHLEVRFQVPTCQRSYCWLSFTLALAVKFLDQREKLW